MSPILILFYRKSTLFKSLSTSQMFPVGGNLTVCGLNTVLDHWAIAARGAVGYVPQEGGLLEFMTVKEAIDLFTGLRATSRPPALAHQTAHVYEQFYSILPHKYFSYTIKSLSGGNKRKLAVVLSNINAPALLLLDEPSSGVDPAAAERIVQYLCDLPAAQGLLFASHRLDECLRVCERVLMLLGGRNQFDGPMAALDSVSDLFYQVDVHLMVDKNDSGVDVSMENFLDSFSSHLNCHMSIERIVVYSPRLVRLTLEKMIVPYSEAWGSLDRLQGESVVEKYAFRRMDMEEIFSIMVSASKKKHTALVDVDDLH
jgi:ABC-type multidrug transport system ATPase subunit